MMQQQIQTARKAVAATNREEKEKADQLKEQLNLGHKLAMVDAKAVQMQSTLRGEKVLLEKQDTLHGHLNRAIMDGQTKQWEEMVETAKEYRGVISEESR